MAGKRTDPMRTVRSKERAWLKKMAKRDSTSQKRESTWRNFERIQKQLKCNIIHFVGENKYMLDKCQYMLDKCQPVSRAVTSICHVFLIDHSYWTHLTETDASAIALITAPQGLRVSAENITL